MRKDSSKPCGRPTPRHGSGMRGADKVVKVNSEKAAMADAGISEDLRRLVEEFVFEYPFHAQVRSWWRKPLLAAACADDCFRVPTETAGMICRSQQFQCFFFCTGVWKPAFNSEP